MCIWSWADGDAGMVMVMVMVIGNGEGASDGIENTYSSREAKSSSISTLQKA